MQLSCLHVGDYLRFNYRELCFEGSSDYAPVNVALGDFFLAHARNISCVTKRFFFVFVLIFSFLFLLLPFVAALGDPLTGAATGGFQGRKEGKGASIAYKFPEQIERTKYLKKNS